MPYTINSRKPAAVFASKPAAVLALTQAILLATFLLAGCGDNASSPFAPTAEGDASVLGYCNDLAEGISIYSPQNKVQYNCQNDKWDITRIQNAIGDIDYSSELLIIPNDPAQQDSLNYRLASGGTYMKLVPNVEYTLSFDALEGDPPTLNLYRDYKEDFSVNATDSAGRYHYHFSLSGKNDSTLYIYHATLTDSDGNIFKKATKNARLTTAMGPYSNHLNVNLIITGPYTSTTDNVAEDELVEKLKKRFNQAFSPGDIFIDKLNVFHAEDHSTYGDFFDFRGPYQMPDNYYHVHYQMLKNWPGKENSLNIILGSQIQRNTAIAFSTLFGGTLQNDANGTPYIIASTSHNSSMLVTAIVHELGHFLGLRHTTATEQDLGADIDQSNTHDGIEDTPDCETLLNQENALGDCRDQTNIMYPYPSATLNQEFSEKQFEIMKKNLSITPH